MLRHYNGVEVAFMNVDVHAMVGWVPEQVWWLILLLAVIVVVGSFQRKRSEQLEASAMQNAIQSGILIRKYKGKNQEQALRSFQTNSTKVADKGFFPTSQSWLPGQWGAGTFIVALLGIIFIGAFFSLFGILIAALIFIVVFLYLLIVKPPGTLTVTYERRAASAEEKTCPRCAERIKAAALVCHFCGNEFPPKPPSRQEVLAQDPPPWSPTRLN